MTDGRPKFHVEQMGGGFKTWCRGCGGLGYAVTQQGVKLQRDRHRECPEEAEEKPRRGGKR